jgi:hypothetical protein
MFDSGGSQHRAPAIDFDAGVARAAAERGARPMYAADLGLSQISQVLAAETPQRRRACSARA